MQHLNKTIQINIIVHALLEERFLKFMTEDKTNKQKSHLLWPQFRSDAVMTQLNQKQQGSWSNMDNTFYCICMLHVRASFESKAEMLLWKEGINTTGR